MFERFKAYKRLKKANKFLEGCKITGELTGDKQLVKEANDALYANEKLKKIMWRDRKAAIDYNLLSIKNGF